ncbi:MAG: hypothetical protein JO235_11320 [Chroococcidiopsidaceae cyanobacterium CP_BM_RX_35]|nr:hypothetical protein [Chroococcidiopsidaceae cyanobacterium CP_BM_RX_35]
MKNNSLFLNPQLVVLPLLTLLFGTGRALADCANLQPFQNNNSSGANYVSLPTNTVGDGTPQSCTEAAFTDAIAQGGFITFNCGSSPNSPYTLSLTSEKTIAKDTVIDGGNSVILDGGGKVRILSLVAVGTNFEARTPSLTVQNLTFLNGHATTDPSDPVTGQQSTSPIGGGAIYRLGGVLNVINSNFVNNTGPLTGQDEAGGAIYTVGGGTTTISGSFFKANRASNGGAIAVLGSGLTIIDSQVVGNQATGTGGNPGDGGNGGGIYIDGNNQTVNLCKVIDNNNQGNAYGGGLIRVVENFNGPTIIDQSEFNGNRAAFAGGVYLQGTNPSLTNSSVINNQVQEINGIGPAFPNLFVVQGSVEDLSSDNIGP